MTTPVGDPAELLTIPEMAAYLRVSKATAQRWCRDRILPAVKLGKDFRMRRSDLAAWYEQRRVPLPADAP